MKIASSFLISYLLGSIPFGLLIGFAVKGIDVRRHGSGNVGATNVFRVIGKKWGILVFFLDALKGFLAVAIVRRFLTEDADSPLILAVGMTAILGHSFPVWMRFKGGKGVATSLGVFLALAFKPALMTFALWMVVFMACRILSVASLVAAAAFPVIIFMTYRGHPLYPWLFGAGMILALFIFYTHRSNIRRLLRKEEKRLF